MSSYCLPYVHLCIQILLLINTVIRLGPNLIIHDLFQRLHLKTPDFQIRHIHRCWGLGPELILWGGDSIHPIEPVKKINYVKPDLETEKEY